VRRGYFLLLIVGLLILFGCAQQEGGLLPSTAPEQIIEVEVGKQVITYHCWYSYWTEEEFSNITETNLGELFNETYDVDAGNFNFSFNKTSHSTVTECHVYGKISKSEDEYIAYFSWFLDPLTLDFIDDNFEESRTGLSWEGNISGVPTNIKIECPPQDSVYGLGPYGVGVGHCHAHIWWPTSSGGLVKCIEIRGKE
jgi:hypothetical protein